MRFLIDGYNVMYAQGLLGKRLGPDHFRKARIRFLNEVAGALGALESLETTIVFDAAAPPETLPERSIHKGLSVIFAIGDQDADERIERLIAADGTPRTLTVVSTDRRIRRAASRRKARSLSADEFLDLLDSRRTRRPAVPPAPPSPSPSPRVESMSAEESAYWHNEFRDLAEEPEIRAALEPAPGWLTDAELAEIERQVEQELDFGAGPSRP